MCCLLLADHCHIRVGLFTRDVDVLSDSRDSGFSCARGCLYDRTFFVRAANDVEALSAKAGRVQPTIKAVARTYLYMRDNLLLGLVVFDTSPKLT